MHNDFYVIATGNPSCFRGRLELPMSLQTRFTTVLMQPIQREELMLIVKDKVPDMPEDEARGWCDAFFEAKRSAPTLTTRALWEALKGAAGCSDSASQIKPVAATAAAAVVRQGELQQPFPSGQFCIDGGRSRVALWAAATVVVGEDAFVDQVHRWICLCLLCLSIVAFDWRRNVWRAVFDVYVLL